MGERARDPGCRRLSGRGGPACGRGSWKLRLTPAVRTAARGLMGKPACGPDRKWRHPSKCAGRPAKGPFCLGLVTRSTGMGLFCGFCGPGRAIGPFADPGVSLSLACPLGEPQEGTGDLSDSPQGPLHALAVRRARSDPSEVRAGQPVRPSDPLGLCGPRQPLASPPRWALCCRGGPGLREAERNPGKVCQAGKKLTR